MELPHFVRSMDEDGDILAADLKSKPRQLLDLWRGWQHDATEAPLKSAIDPIRLGKAGLMPDVWLIGLQQDGRFRFSLSGENANNRFNFTLRGKTVEETFDPATAAFANYRYRRIISDQCLEFSRGPVTRNGEPYYYAYRLILPLQDGNGESAFAIGVAETKDLDPQVEGGGTLQFYFDEIILTPIAKLRTVSAG